MIYTLFQYPYHAVTSEACDDPALSVDKAIFPPSGGTKQNVLWRKEAQVNLNNATTYALQTAGSASDWQLLMLRVTGACRLDTTGTDASGAAITGKLPFYGTAQYPDMGIISTYNITGLTLEGLQDGTTVEVFAAVLCNDADSRLTTYA